MRRLLCALVLLAGCEEPDSGTAVGNPGDAAFAIASTSGVTLTEAVLPLDRLHLRGCAPSSSDVVATATGDIDLLDPDHRRFDLPGTAVDGTSPWCRAIVRPSGPLRISGTWDSGDAQGTLTATLELTDVAIPLSPPLDVDGEALVVELGRPDWLTASLLAREPSRDVVVDRLHPLHAALADQIARRSGVYDDDGDGVVSEAERETPRGTAQPAPTPALLLAAGADFRTLLSLDGGETWASDRSDPPSPDLEINAAAFGGGVFVAVGGADAAVYGSSVDGVSWSRVTDADGPPLDVLWTGQEFVAVGFDGLRAWSDDGLHWREAEAGAGQDWNGVALGDGRLVAVSLFPGAAWSDDFGRTWTETTLELAPGDTLLKSVAFGDGVFVAVGFDGRRLASTDGEGWTESLGGDDLHDVIWDGARFVAVGAGRVLTSADGAGWDEIPLTEPLELRAVHATGGGYVAAGLGDALWRSDDLEAWTLTSERGLPGINAFASSP